MFWPFERDGRKDQFDAVHIPFLSGNLCGLGHGNKAVCGPEIQGKGQEVQPADLSQQAMYSLFGIVLYKRTATTTNLASNEFKIVNL